MPNIGCLVGTAYQTMLSGLSEALASAGLGISAAEYLVLRVLYDREGIRQCDIAEALGKDKASVCRCVSGMAAKGLVTTETVSHKCLRVYVSAKGNAIKDAVMAVAARRDQQLSSLVTDEERRVFIKVLNAIINS